MTLFVRKYSDKQRAAIQQAWGDRGIRPARAIVALAAEGKLTHNGELIPAFEVTGASVNDIGRRYIRARERTARSRIANESPRDAIELVRRRLLTAVDGQLEHVEKLQAAGKHDRINAENLRQIARAAREIAALPGPEGSPAPLKHRPGSRDLENGGAVDGGRTRGGLAGAILAAAGDRPISTAQDDDPHTHPPSSEHDTTSAGIYATASAATDSAHTQDSDDESADPGTYARAQVARLGARVSSVRPA